MIDIDSLFFWFNKFSSYLSEYLESIKINIDNKKPTIIRANLKLSFSKIGDLLISKYGYEMKNKLIATAIITCEGLMWVGLYFVLLAFFSYALLP